MNLQEFFNTRYLYQEDGTLISKITNKPVGQPNSEGYIRLRITGKEYRAHRVIWIMFNGELKEEELIDHIDGNRSNNRIENLRTATRQQNNVNSIAKTKKSLLPKGVIVARNKFRARIYFNKTWINLGNFDKPYLAYIAYISKALELHGELTKVDWRYIDSHYDPVDFI